MNIKNKLSDKLYNLLESNKFKQVLTVACVTLVCAVIFFSGYFISYFTLNKNIRSVSFFFEVYNDYYYKESDANVVDLLVDSLLDDYSKYFTPDEYEEYTKSEEGNKKGLGIALSGTIIKKVIGNSPAEKAGVEIGGEIVAFKNSNERDFIECESKKHLDDFFASCSDEVTIRVRYGSEYREYELVKAEYTAAYAYYSDSTGSYRYQGNGKSMALTKHSENTLPLKEGWGYLKYIAFDGLADGTMGGAGQFIGALQTFKQNGNSKIIIDLRGNGGGYVTILCEIASHLCNVQSNKPFVCQKTKDNTGKISESYSPKSNYDDYQFEKIVFLVDSTTASASEALVGAVLDYDKFSNSNIVRVIVEPSNENNSTSYRSYGKGIMQSLYENPLTGEAIKVTTAEVYWPLSNICIHKTGITPTLDERIIANTFGDAIAFAQTV